MRKKKAYVTIANSFLAEIRLMFNGKKISGTRLICKLNDMLDQNRDNVLVSSFFKKTAS